MIDEVAQANELEDVVSFIESIADVACKSRSKQHDLKGIRLYCETINQSKDDGKQLLGLIKYIANLALRSEKLFDHKGVRILRKNAKGFLYYSSEQIACVLAHAFF